LERSAPFVERVGLDYVKQRVVADADGCKALVQRFCESQAYAQVDPWEERASAGVNRDYYQPLKQVG
jgi:nitrite reductase (NADH) large subunit